MYVHLYKRSTISCGEDASEKCMVINAGYGVDIDEIDAGNAVDL